MKTQRPVWGLLLPLLLLVGLAACAVSRPSQVQRAGNILLVPGSPVEQSFVARYAGLQAVEIRLEPTADPPEALLLQLWNGAGSDPGPLTQSRYDLPQEIEPGWLTLPFDIQPDSAGQFYRLQIEAAGPGGLPLATGGPGSYLDGALSQNGLAVEAQLAFRLNYRTFPAAFGLLGDGMLAAGMLALASLVFVLPGWGLLLLLDSAWNSRSLFERLVLSAGAGLAQYPVIILWTHLAGWNLGQGYVWLPPLFGLLALLVGRRARKTPRKEKDSLNFRRLDWLTILVVALLLFSRFWPLRTLGAGMWGDSVHHTLITQLLLDNGGLFSSWQPYADLTTFTYHFGFHSAAALLAWGARLPVEKAVLWAGQLVNLLAVLALYPLTRRLASARGNRAAHWAGLAAVLLAGFAAPMPAVYTNWGRYTQVAGQAVLLVWMALALEAFDRRMPTHRTAALHALLLAGLGLTHYRVLIFGLLFISAYWALHVWRSGPAAALTRVAWVGIPAGLLFLPWFWRVFGGQIMYIVGSQLTTPAGQVSQTIENYNRVGELSAYLPLWTWWLLPVVVLWGIYRREAGVLIIGIWAALLALLANPGWLGLPGAGVVNNFAVLIAAYMPAAVLIGLGAGKIQQVLNERLAPPPLLIARLFALLFISAAAWGALGQIRQVRLEGHALVTRPDVEAAKWIRQNTSPDAFFLVNAFTAGSGTTVAGSDAGWWLPLLAGRKVTLPPFIFIAERNLDPDYSARILALTQAVNQSGPSDPGVISMLKDWGVSHVYIGQLQGAVNNRSRAIDPAALQASQAFDLLYQQDHVWIFRFLP